MALFTYRGGVMLVETGLTFDSLRGQDLCFVSSAAALCGAQPVSASGHRRSTRRSRAVLLCTEKTLALSRMLIGEQSLPAAQLVTPCGRPFQFGSLRLELFPSGAQPGAASLLVRLRSSERVIYAGAPRLPAGLFAEPIQLRTADELVIAAPLASQSQSLPSREDALAAALSLCADARDADACTIFLVSPFGSDVELCAQLLSTETTTLLHPRIAQIVKAYAAVNALALPRSLSRLSLRKSEPLPAGAVALWPLDEALPPSLLQPTVPQRLRVCIFSGQALQSEVTDNLRARNEEEAATKSGRSWHAIPYPDALDRKGLLHYLSETGARRVRLLSGYSDELAAALLARGITAEALGPPRQLALFSQLSAP